MNKDVVYEAIHSVTNCIEWVFECSVTGQYSANFATYRQEDLWLWRSFLIYAYCAEHFEAREETPIIKCKLPFRNAVFHLVHLSTVQTDLFIPVPSMVPKKSSRRCCEIFYSCRSHSKYHDIPQALLSRIRDYYES